MALLMGMPPIIVTTILLLNPSFIHFLFAHPIGHFLLVTGLGFLLFCFIRQNRPPGPRGDHTTGPPRRPGDRTTGEITGNCSDRLDGALLLAARCLRDGHSVQAKAAIKGNVEAAKLLLGYADLDGKKGKDALKKRPRLKHLWQAAEITLRCELNRKNPKFER
jgi:hypothetical protein